MAWLASLRESPLKPVAKVGVSGGGQFGAEAVGMDVDVSVRRFLSSKPAAPCATCHIMGSGPMLHSRPSCKPMQQHSLLYVCSFRLRKIPRLGRRRRCEGCCSWLLAGAWRREVQVEPFLEPLRHEASAHRFLQAQHFCPNTAPRTVLQRREEPRLAMK